MTMACELCDSPGGEILWKGERLRIVRVDEPGYPGFCRVIWREHVREMTDLAPDDRAYLMSNVFAVETVLREQLRPVKVNLASLGTAVPHLHWHAIARFDDDPHFPNPVWSTAQRAARPGVHVVSSAALSAALAVKLI